MYASHDPKGSACEAYIKKGGGPVVLHLRIRPLFFSCNEITQRVISLQKRKGCMVAGDHAAGFLDAGGWPKGAGPFSAPLNRF
jgi:hypothetical protein